MKNILVSIGLPTYNGEKFLEEALTSLLAQTYKNIEIIISDNASSDRTSSICQKFSAKHKNIIYFRQEKNIGLVNNFNFVLEKANGISFMWASDDDLWDSNYVETLQNLMETDSNSVLSICNYIEFNKDQTVKRGILYMNNKNQIPGLIFLKNSPERISAFLYGVYKTSVLKQIGGIHQDKRPFFDGFSDIATVFKVLLHGNLVYSDNYLLRKRDSGNYLNAFEVLQQKNLQKDVVFRIKRYIKQPIGYVLDLYSGLRALFSTTLPSQNKIILTLYLIRFFFTNLFLYCKNIILGGWFVFRGQMKKIIH